MAFLSGAPGVYHTCFNCARIHYSCIMSGNTVTSDISDSGVSENVKNSNFSKIYFGIKYLLDRKSVV